MNYKKLTVLFILSFFIWAEVFLYRDVKEDLLILGVKSFFLSLLSTTIVAFAWPPIRRWYRKNYDKNYKYSNSRDLPRKKK